MDKTVPPSAALLLDFIRETEVGRKDRASYDVIYGHKQNKLKKPLTSMTIREIINAQPSWSKNHGSSAAGGYQFMRATLIGLLKEIPSIKDTSRFVSDLQDRLAYHLLKRRGYAAYMAREISMTEFGRRLAMEWASFPVLAATKGSTRQIKRGQCYYAGDGLNKTLVKPEKVEELLREVLEGAGQADKKTHPIVLEKPVVADPGELGTPASKSKTAWTWGLAGVGATVSAVGDFMGGLDWRVQIFISAVTVSFAIYGIKRRADLARAVRHLKAEFQS